MPCTSLSESTAEAESETAPTPWVLMRWQTVPEKSKRYIDHSLFDAFLKKHVVDTKHGLRLDYKNISDSASGALHKYIRNQSQVIIRQYNASEQFAYWVNLYNAIVIHWGLTYYPIDSMQDIQLSNDPFVHGPWQEKLITIEDASISLNDIETRILRPIWKDPRLHYVLMKGAKSFNTSNQAVSGKHLEKQLKEAATRFINNPKNIHVKDGILQVPAMYKYYLEDFGGSQESLKKHLMKFADSELKKHLEKYEINSREFDWTLNEP